jgi:hypothetical protein
MCYLLYHTSIYNATVVVGWKCTWMSTTRALTVLWSLILGLLLASPAKLHSARAHSLIVSAAASPDCSALSELARTDTTAAAAAEIATSLLPALLCTWKHKLHQYSYTHLEIVMRHCCTRCSCQCTQCCAACSYCINDCKHCVCPVFTLYYQYRKEHC